MPQATSDITFFNSFRLEYGKGSHDFSSDVLKVALFDDLPDYATAELLADLTGEVANGNGYTTGGNTVDNTLWDVDGPVASLTGDDVVFTPTGAGFGPFQYAVLYNDSATGDMLIGFYAYTSSESVAPPVTFTVDFDDLAILTLE